MSDSPLFRGRAGLAGLIVVGLLVIVGFVRSTGEQQPQTGPSGSSYATHSSGAAALAALLERNGYEVSQLRTPVAELPPSPDDVLVVIGGYRLEHDDIDPITRFVSGGGRLVAVDSSLNGIVASPPDVHTSTRLPAQALLNSGPFRTFDTAFPEYVWSDAGSLLPLVGNTDGTLVGITYIGDGTVVAIADAGIIENGELNQADHALLAMQAIGDPTGTVRFVEYIHGFTRPTGLSALPTRWKQALFVLAAAGTLWLIARGKRFEPVEESGRPLPPPRAAYVDALAFTLAAGKDPEASALLDRTIEDELRRRGVEPGTPEATSAAVASGADRELCDLALSAASTEAAIRAKSVLLSYLINKEQL